MNRLFPVLTSIFLVLQLNAQLVDVRWSGSMHSDRSFIENKGQFDGRTNVTGEKVLYAVDEGTLQILFTDRGVTYRIDQKEKNYYRQRGDRTKPRMFTKSDLVRMVWEGASPTARLVVEDMTADPHTYSSLNADRSVTDLTGVRGYRKLVYKGLYPKIDVEYTIHPEKGIKYTLLLQPGADLSVVKMRYDDGRKLTVGTEGNLHIGTIVGEIVDHAPVSHYKRSTSDRIGSRFNVQGQVVRIALDAYDAGRAVVVDPWVVTPPFGNSNKIWDVEVDAASNVYVYGGDTPARLRKYDPSGNLLWTYNTPWDTSGYWTGSLITDPAGNSFISAGTDPRIARINPAGGLVWSANGGGFDEYWRMSFNCDYTQMVMGGTRLTLGPIPSPLPIGFGTAFRIDLNNGAVLSNANVASLSPSAFINNPNEIRALCPSPNGRYYFLTLDTIGCITEDLDLIYRRNSTYAFSYRVAGFGVTNMAINGIAATSDFIYTQNGSTLHKRSIATGEIIGSVTIPGGITSNQLGSNSAENSGLVLDSCGNVYAGSANGVYKFDADLNPLGSAVTPGRVYDVAVNYNGEILACGQGFVASLDIPTCAPPLVECCYSSIDPIDPLCANGAPVTMTAETPGGTWSGNGITNPTTGVFDPTVAGVGTHDVTYTLACGSSTIQVIVGPCAPLSVCRDPGTGTLNASNGVGTYTWEQQTTVEDCSACFILCLAPPGCAVNVLAWTPLATGPSIPTPGTFPIRVTDGAGTVLVINSLAEVPDCVPCPTITVQSSGIQGVLCFGQNAGAATVTADGGTGPYQYSWTPGGASGNAQTTLGAGSYQVTATDAVGCTGTTTVDIPGPAAIVITVDNITGATCAGGDGSATISVTGGTGTLTIAWSPEGGNGTTASGLDQGVYTVEVTDANNCIATTTVIVPSVDGPVITDVVTTPSACAPPDGTITITATGTGLEYSLDGTTFQQSNTFTDVPGGVYTVVIRDGEGCIASGTATVISPTATVPVVTGPSFACAGDTLILGTTAPFSGYVWSTGGSGATTTVTTSGAVTVTVTDADGCVATSVPFDVEFETPQAGFTATPPSPQLPGVTVDFNDVSTPGGGTITGWNWDLGEPGATESSPDVSWTYDETGQYTVVLVVTTANGCSDSTSMVYVVRPADIDVPNVFSPNGDGSNDTFNILNIEFFRNELVIINRWGNEVFSAKDYRNQWRASGHPDGTYYYVLRLEDGREFTGHVTVVR
jgi:gliding motility-associated-like protein